MKPILNTKLPVMPWQSPATRRLPGVQPLDLADWLPQDEVYARQMARRDHLIDKHIDSVYRIDPRADDAAEELYALVARQLRNAPGFQFGEGWVRRPDGIRAPITETLLTLGRLCQQDFCILQKEGEEHILTGAILCFPANWRLSEKFLRPLSHIHDPVDVYTPDMARRVQRLFDMLHPDRPLWRVNALAYADPELFQPDRKPQSENSRYIRSERQCLVKLRETGAVVFSIHTHVVDMKTLPAGHLVGFRRNAVQDTSL